MSRTKILDVYLHNRLVGRLEQAQSGKMMFQYTSDYWERPDANPISHSLPLQATAFSHRECEGFFGGLLPEAETRRKVAKNLGISDKNDFSMLYEIGGECAGAVTLLPQDIAFSDNMSSHESIPLNDAQIAKILRDLPYKPLMAGEEGIRLSLAGAQTKIPVIVHSDGKISIPSETNPSTHIIKPQPPHYEGLVYNEALCMILSKNIGIATANVEIRQAEEINYLLVERYDRKKTTPPKTDILRLHQEDMCQALAIPSQHKYQKEGGPSFKKIFSLMRDMPSINPQSLSNFIDAIIYNYLIGNCDAHGKNFSIVYNQIFQFNEILSEGFSYISPLYDLVCTIYYDDLDKNMAMKIGDQYDSNLVLPKDFEKMAEECGLSKPLVKKRVVEIAKKIISALENRIVDHPIADKVAELIRSRCKDTIESFQG